MNAERQLLHYLAQAIEHRGAESAAPAGMVSLRPRASGRRRAFLHRLRARIGALLLVAIFILSQHIWVQQTVESTTISHTPEQETGMYEEDFTAYTYKEYTDGTEWDIWSQALRMGRTDGIEQYSPDIAVDEEGYAFVVWVIEHEGIRIQRLDPSGNRMWQTDISVSANELVSLISPDVTIDPSGNAVVVWVDTRDGDCDIYAQKITPTGNRLWAHDIEISSDDGTEDQWAPAVASDSAGNIVIVWGEDSTIYAQKLDANGNKLWPDAVQVSDASGYFDVDRWGNILVVWWSLTENNIYAQRLSPSGVKLWSSDVKVNAEHPGGSPVEPAVAVDDGGEAFVAWGSGPISAQRLSTDGNLLWSGDVHVDITTNAYGWEPSIAVDQNNNAIITWDDRSYVYAQKINRAGTLMWSGSVLVPVNDRATYRASSNVAVDQDGRAMITWWERANSDIYAQKLDTDGVQLWEADARVNFGSGTAIQRGNVVVTDMEGKSFIVWQDSRNGYTDVYVRRLDENGNRLWDGDVRVNTLMHTIREDVYWNTEIDATLDANGDLVVVWGDIRDDTGDIYAQKVDVNGNRLWVTDVRVNSDSKGHSQWSPVISSDGTGNTIVVWADTRNSDSDIYAQKLDSAGHRLWPADVRVNSDTGTRWQCCPDVDIGDNGDIVIVWEDVLGLDKSDVYAQKLTSDGGKLWAEDLQVNVNGSADAPSVAVDPSGNAIISYEGGCAIYAQKLARNGALLWDDGIIINDVVANESLCPKLPSIAVSDNGEAYIAWWDDLYGGESDIYAQKLSAAGSRLWAHDVKVNSADSETGYPSLDLDTNGDLIVAWVDGRNANDDIYVQKLNPSGAKLWAADVPIVSPDYFYLPNGRAQSRSVDTVSEDITQATLTADYQLNGGSVRFYLTNDGGTHWAEVLPGVTHLFTTTGSDLRWRIEMASDPVRRNRAPVINSLRIEYSTNVPGGDDYEPDDTCTQAQPIQVNGAAQRHNFHQYEDSDWVWFEAQAGSTYIIQTTNTASRADTVLELYDQCGQPPEQSDDNEFGPGATLQFTAPSSGRYYVRVLQHDGSVYGDDTDYDLSVRTQMSQGAVIIVAGRLRESDSVQPIINATANLAYQTFIEAGFSDDDILYLNSDLTQPGVDDVPSWENVRDAIQEWARARVGPGTPLWLYLADHGNVDRFHNEVGEVVTAGELNLWLSNLEATSGVDQVNVIVDACYSGSFIDTYQSNGYGLDEISGHGRVVVASTTSRWSAYAPRIVPGQPTPLMYFSDGFWHALGEGQDVWHAFLAGRATVEAGGQRCGDYAYTCQRPWLDDNGDAWFDEEDGLVAQSRGLAATFGGGVAPYIDWVQVSEVTDGQATIQAQVRDDGSVTRVWARVFAPSFAPPESTDGSIPVIDVPEVELSAASGDVYQLDYTGFTEPGVYQVVVYAQDDEGNVAAPKWTLVGEKKVYLPLVLRSR